MSVTVTKPGEEDYSIKPTAVTPAVDTSQWPLLLKNWEKRMCAEPVPLWLQC
jgi:hypothetical protein